MTLLGWGSLAFNPHWVTRLPEWDFPRRRMFLAREGHPTYNEGGHDDRDTLRGGSRPGLRPSLTAQLAAKSFQRSSAVGASSSERRRWSSRATGKGLRTKGEAKGTPPTGLGQARQEQRRQAPRQEPARRPNCGENLEARAHRFTSREHGSSTSRFQPSYAPKPLCGASFFFHWAKARQSRRGPPGLLDHAVVMEPMVRSQREIGSGEPTGMPTPTPAPTRPLPPKRPKPIEGCAR